MSSASGLKTTDGQRLNPRLAAICASTTPTLNLAARRPLEPIRASLAQVLAGFGAQHRGDAVSRDLEIPGPGGPLAARLYEPTDLTAPSPLVVFFHGGGWVVGNIASHDGSCRFLARRAGARVLAVDYRLAPETRFPGAADDALAALAWAQEHADEIGADPARIGVGGDSAGGNLSAVAALYATQKPAFALLIYPLIDADLERYETSTHLFAKGPLLSRQALQDFVRHYAPSPRSQLDPRVSPIDADLHGLPPTYVATAGMDPLRDQGEAFAARAREAGAPVQARRFDNMPHGFFNLLIEPEAKAAAEAMVLDARRIIAG